MNKSAIATMLNRITNAKNKKFMNGFEEKRF
jgi:hypothetical protein